MANLQLPVRSDVPHYDFTIELDKVIYQFTFHWNERVEQWTFDLALEDGTPLLAGIPVVVNWPLISRFKDERLPKGFLFSMDVTGQSEEIRSIGDLGDRVLLMYSEAG